MEQSRTQGPAEVESYARLLESPHDDLERQKEILLRTINVSPKSISLMLIVAAGGSITPSELVGAFREVYSDTQFENVDDHTPRGYFEYFARDGLVKLEFTDWRAGTSKVSRYVLTKAGSTAVLAAALEVDFEYRNEFGLSEVVGTPSKPDANGYHTPFTAVSVLRYLMQQEYPVRQVDIVNDLGISKREIRSVLKNLKTGGVIDCEGQAFKLNNKGRLVDEELFDPFIALVEDKGDIRDQIQFEIMPNVLTNLREYARKTLPFYYERSHSYKKREHRKNRAKILAYIAESSIDGTTVQELANRVGLTQSAVRHVLSTYVKAGYVFCVVEPGVVNHYYFLNPDTRLRADRGRSVRAWLSLIRSKEQKV